MHTFGEAFRTAFKYFMEKSKLIEILKKLEPSEIERLKAYMVSPYFVQQQSLSAFATLILNEYPLFPGDKINETWLYGAVFSGQKFNSQTIRDLMTLFIAAINNWLAIETFLNDPIEIKLVTMQALRSKDISKEFLRTGAKLENVLDVSYKNQEYYLHLMRYEDEMDHYFFSKQYLGFSKFLQTKSDSLDFYYLASKLKLACEMINRQNVYAGQYHISLQEEVIEYIRGHLSQFENVPAVNIYYLILLTLIKPDDEQHFFELKEILEKVSGFFTNEELKEMYGYAQNYSIKKINSGHYNYSFHRAKIA